jgi:hypothetical protein
LAEAKSLAPSISRRRSLTEDKAELLVIPSAAIGGNAVTDGELQRASAIQTTAAVTTAKRISPA